MTLLKKIFPFVGAIRRDDVVCTDHNTDSESHVLVFDGLNPPLYGEFVFSTDYSFLPYFKLTNHSDKALHNIEIKIDDAVATKAIKIKAILPGQTHEIGIEQGQIFYPGDEVTIEINHLKWIQTFQFTNS